MKQWFDRWGYFFNALAVVMLVGLIQIAGVGIILTVALVLRDHAIPFSIINDVTLSITTLVLIVEVLGMLYAGMLIGNSFVKVKKKGECK